MVVYVKVGRGRGIGGTEWARNAQKYNDIQSKTFLEIDFNEFFYE